MAALEEKLQNAERIGTLPKVVVPVHLAGSSCDMATIGALAKRYGFGVLEDASHAIGGQYQGEPVGNCRHSAITVFSFHPVKIITTGEGGMATTNDQELAQRMTELRSHGIVREPERFEHLPAGPWIYEQQQLGFNYRMTDLQAALGLNQLKRLGAIVAERNRQLNCYRELLTDLPLRILDIPKDSDSSVHLSVICLEKANAMQHLTVFNRLRASGIGVQQHYSPIHLQPYYRKLGYGEGMFEHAEVYASRCMSLPLYPGLTDEDQIFVTSNLKRVCYELFMQ